MGPWRVMPLMVRSVHTGHDGRELSGKQMLKVQSATRTCCSEPSQYAVKEKVRVREAAVGTRCTRNKLGGIGSRRNRVPSQGSALHVIALQACGERGTKRSLVLVQSTTRTERRCGCEMREGGQNGGLEKLIKKDSIHRGLSAWISTSPLLTQCQYNRPIILLP